MGCSRTTFDRLLVRFSVQPILGPTPTFDRFLARRQRFTHPSLASDARRLRASVRVLHRSGRRKNPGLTDDDCRSSGASRTCAAMMSDVAPSTAPKASGPRPLMTRGLEEPSIRVAAAFVSRQATRRRSRHYSICLGRRREPETAEGPWSRGPPPACSRRPLLASATSRH